MANDTEARQYQRAADYVSGIGDNLDTLLGRDILLHSVDISKRPMRGNVTDFVAMKISEIDTPDEIEEYHAWSTPLAESFTQLLKNSEVHFPVVLKFKRTQTTSGFRIWTFE